MNLITALREIEANLKRATNAIRTRWPRTTGSRLLAVVLIFAAASPLMAQGTSPWENAVEVLRLAFTTTIARGLSLVAIVLGGLMYAFGESDSKRHLAGIVFGVGMAIGAVNS